MRYLAVHTLDSVDDALCGQEVRLCVAMLLPAGRIAFARQQHVHEGTGTLLELHKWECGPS